MRPGSPTNLLLLIGALAAIGAIAFLAARRSDPAGASPGRTLPVAASSAASPPSTLVAEFVDAFDGAMLDPARWAITSDGDFEERVVDVVGSRLRFRAATRGTRDDTVKFFGVRSVPKIAFGKETRVSVEIDWNNQANGSYLSAGIVLAPSLTEANPLVTSDFLRVEYIGVPPGKYGRIVLVTRKGGREQYLFTEGWPDLNREGRPIGVQKVEIVIRAGAFEIMENGRKIFASKEKALSFDQAYLYLQMSSHSNYPPREVFFDSIAVTGLH